MEKRKNNKEGVRLVDSFAKSGKSSRRILREVRMGEHGALRLARRAGSVYHTCDVVLFTYVLVVPSACAALLLEFRKVVNGNVADSRIGRRASVYNDNRPEIRKLGGNLLHHRNMGRIRGDDNRAGILQNVFNLVIMKLRIQRNHGNPRTGTGKVHIHPLRAVLQSLSHILFTRFQTELRAVRLGGGAHILQERTVRAIRPLLAAAEYMGHVIRMLTRKSFES